MLVCDEFLGSATSKEGPRSYLNALQQINDLRMICNLGVSSVKTREVTHQQHLADEPLTWTPETAQKAFKNLAEVGEALCFLCEQDFTAQPFEIMEQQLAPRLSQCLKVICSDCVQLGLGCGCRSKCRLASVSLNGMDETLSSGSTEHNLSSNPTPTKVKALLQDLQNDENGTKRFHPAISHTFSLTDMYQCRVLVLDSDSRCD